MTPDEFSAGFATIGIAYPKFDVGQTATETWYTFFSHIKADTFSKAVRRHISASRYPPKISELLVTAKAVTTTKAVMMARAVTAIRLEMAAREIMMQVAIVCLKRVNLLQVPS